MYRQLFFFLALPLTVFASFQEYQNTLTQEEVADRLSDFLEIEGGKKSYIELEGGKLVLYDKPKGESGREEEFVLQLSPCKKPSSPCLSRGLKGTKIALDPGHLGGKYARLEARFIDIPPSLERENRIQFDEGTLSFLTALHLKELLAAEGAEVMLTRDEIGKGVYADDFFEWLRANPELWGEKHRLSHLFRVHYNPLDLRARAAKINAFAPDLTIMIHYNSHHVEESDSSNHGVTPSNYNLVFIPGAFGPGELSSKESRDEFLRLLVTDDVEKSAGLSLAIVNAFSEKLQVPVVSKADGARYLDRVCLKIEEGVYARNLALTRLVHGPLCYGETLIQNNVDECLNLGRKDSEIGGVRCSSRIIQVAEAYFEGIKSWLQNGSGQSGRQEPSPQ